MNRPLSLTPSLSYALDDLRGEPAPDSDAGQQAPPQLRFATDVLGMAIFFVMLGTYLTAHL